MKLFKKILPGLIILFLGIIVFITLNNKPSDDVNNLSDPSKIETTDSQDYFSIIDAGSHNFENIISEGVVLVDFWAEWCPPCRIQNPILEDLAKEIGKNALIAKVDVDNHGELAANYNVRNIPTLILFRDGEPVEFMVGVQQKEELKTIIYKHL